MSARFVAAGSDPGPAFTSENDGWAKARHDVEKRKDVKSLETGKQDDGKSLYEVLQANKAAKQEAFEEASKVRNQFRSLDDSEVEFLDSVRESERAKEDSVRQETLEQLELFKKQQYEIEQAVKVADNKSKDSEQEANSIWKASKKRRREKDDIADSISKSRKASTAKSDEDIVKSTTGNEGRTTDRSNSENKHPPVTPIQAAVNSINVVKPAGLGLFAYESDDD